MHQDGSATPRRESNGTRPLGNAAGQPAASTMKWITRIATRPSGGPFPSMPFRSAARKRRLAHNPAAARIASAYSRVQAATGGYTLRSSIQ